VLNDLETDAVLILTRHDSHARFVTEALKAGKHVFVEKPLVINGQQLTDIIRVYRSVSERPSPTPASLREASLSSPNFGRGRGLGGW
jgi:hypothetical protein